MWRLQTLVAKKKELNFVLHVKRSAYLEGNSCGGVIFNYPLAETLGGVGLTPPANKMAALRYNYIPSTRGSRHLEI